MTIGISLARAVATMILSAGSAWSGPGRKTERPKMALSTGTKLKNGSAWHWAIPSRMTMISVKRPLIESIAASQMLMDDMRIERAADDITIALRAGALSCWRIVYEPYPGMRDCIVFLASFGAFVVGSSFQSLTKGLTARTLPYRRSCWKSSEISSTRPKHSA